MCTNVCTYLINSIDNDNDRRGLWTWRHQFEQLFPIAVDIVWYPESSSSDETGQLVHHGSKDLNKSGAFGSESYESVNYQGVGEPLKKTNKFTPQLTKVKLDFYRTSWDIVEQLGISSMSFRIPSLHEQPVGTTCH